MFLKRLLSFSYVAVHPLNHLKSIKEDLTIVNMVRIDKLYFLFYFFVFIFTSGWLFVQLGRHYLDFRRAVLSRRMNEYYAMTKRLLMNRARYYNLTLKVLRVCFLLYAHVFLYYFTLSLVNISLSTNKILIDYSSVIYDRAQMMRTERQLCFFKNDGVLPFFRTSPKYCFYRKLYDAKYRRCHIGYGIIRGMQFQLNSFLITNYQFANILVGSLIGFTKVPYWISSEQFSLNVAHMIRRNLKTSVKRKLQTYGMLYLEANLQNYVHRRSVHESRHFYVGTNEKIFESLETIIAEHSKFISNDLRSYSFIFLLLFGFEFSLLAVFLAWKLWKKLNIQISRRYRIYQAYLKIYLKQRQMKNKNRFKKKTEKQANQKKANEMQ